MFTIVAYMMNWGLSNVVLLDAQGRAYTAGTGDGPWTLTPVEGAWQRLLDFGYIEMDPTAQVATPTHEAIFDAWASVGKAEG